MGQKKKLEREFEREFLEELQKRFWCFVLPKNDAGLQQGIPDRTVLFLGGGWAVLEIKRDRHAPYRPNQEYFLKLLEGMCYSATVYPENEERILREIEQKFPVSRREQTRDSESK